ncbi:hypothetical protein NEOLEDRAFT_1142271 [Neolentinus lepideus HHB14362 ss-1]|uniref:CENP-C homolog n=1 Tax=Neolentinus lepideus HHB14362 ss-1 TaxID=1314782 RepID=A0A165N732_9AGAM|nr:hypothetical protein NEOLEDRAFT_1142271 [Neolentinus lepideus HHB14362 ss-1]
MVSRKPTVKRSIFATDAEGSERSKHTGAADSVPQSKSSGEFDDFEYILRRGDDIAPAKAKPGGRLKGLFPSSVNHADELEMSVGPEVFENTSSRGNMPEPPFPSSSHNSDIARRTTPRSVAGVATRRGAVHHSSNRSMTPNSSGPSGAHRQAYSSRDTNMQLGQSNDNYDEVPTSEGPTARASPNKKGKRKTSDANEKTRPSKKARTLNLTRRDSKRSPKKYPIAEQTPSDDGHTHEGLRRSPRKRYEPLEWWRLEKAVYSLRAMGGTNVPHIKEIIRLPKEPTRSLSAVGRRRRKRKPRQSVNQVESDTEITRPNSGQSWDDNTESHGVVVDYVTKDEVEKHIVSTFKMLQPKPASNEDFFFQRVFGDGGFMAAGYLTIPPGKAKPSKNTKDNTYVFYVIEGAVNFRLNQNSFILATGGEFLAPRGNTYYIQNISDRETKLFFAQARKVPVEEDEEAPMLPSRDT